MFQLWSVILIKHLSDDCHCATSNDTDNVTDVILWIAHNARLRLTNGKNFKHAISFLMFFFFFGYFPPLAFFLTLVISFRIMPWQLPAWQTIHPKYKWNLWHSNAKERLYAISRRRKGDAIQSETFAWNILDLTFSFFALLFTWLCHRLSAGWS